MAAILRPTSQGLYCPAGDFHIDPSSAVERAVITHAHSDHARSGSRRYWCASPGRKLLELRVGAKNPIEAVPFGEKFRIGDATVSFHSAGHILGSAQVRVEVGGEVWVASGDYKRDADPTCAPFEVVPCDAFITEATFGLPIYRWPELEQVAREMLAWWQAQAEAGRNCIVYGYSLGKAQRVMAELAKLGAPEVLIHPTVAPLARAYEDEGVDLGRYRVLSSGGPDLFSKSLRGQLLITPPGASLAAWDEALGETEEAFASGWMISGAIRRTRGYQRGFVVSDHADFPTLVRTIQETGARKVFVHHDSSQGGFVRYLREKGFDAQSLNALRDGGGGR